MDNENCMCGIAGIFGEGTEQARHAAHLMCDALARRGPDSEGMNSWSDAVLAHRRLAIFDLSDAGRQPMLSPDGEIAVVFNGAIYNFHDLRAELERAGFAFRSNTDTEVLIHGYRAWGFDSLVSRLRGMFAIGLWDNPRRRAFLVRDRLGVKPLVYALRNGTLAFASTVRALRQGGYASDIDEQAVVEFLEFGFVTDDRTIYRDVSKVPAATIIEWSNGRIATRQYWQPPPVRERGGPSFEEAVEETERLFLRAAEIRLQADVPVGSLLSGGIDSSLVCWAVAHLGGDITAFTVGTPGDPLDETDDALATARELGIRHRVLPSTAQDSPEVEELVSAYGEPFACASALGMLKVSRAVREEATVLLTGDGGDDVFLGYPEHRHFYYSQSLARRLPGFLLGPWRSLRGSIPRAGLLRRATHFFDFATGGLGAVTHAHDGLPVYQRHGLLGERLAAARLPRREIPWSTGSARRLLTDFLEYDRRTRFTGEYLTKVDGATMHYALEARSPFLDHELWSFAASLPYEIRLKDGTLKAVLRELARRKIGERVASGRKRGFGIPVQRWIAGRWRPKVEECFRDSLLAKEGWVRPGPVLDRLQAAAGRAPNQLWYLFVLESWLRYERAMANSAALLQAE
jgi:asparagine synthase (glutamine-hydrolysing)